jgi:hypothetical protein
VEDESAKWERSLLSAEFPHIPPRIATEYSTTIFEIALIPWKGRSKSGDGGGVKV